MYTTKVSLVLVALVAGVALVQAAGGIKGQRGDDSQQRPQAIKGPRQQQFLPPPPPPPPTKNILPAAQPIKGAGQVAPVFQPARVQPIIQQQEQEPAELVQQQVQQQVQEEIDPNAAAQEAGPTVIAPAAAAASEEEANPKPEPYSFQYSISPSDQATSGSSDREEQQDASGKVTGFYTLKGEDGRDRRVEYFADASGFHATITTNEMGTAPKDSADAIWRASAPTDAQLRAAESATQAARQRALLNPQPAGSGSSFSKVSSPRQKAASRPIIQQQQQLAESSAPISQLQEPFEQIRQTELNNRARKSRHAPFYLFTV